MAVLQCYILLPIQQQLLPTTLQHQVQKSTGNNSRLVIEETHMNQHSPTRRRKVPEGVSKCLLNYSVRDTFYASPPQGTPNTPNGSKQVSKYIKKKPFLWCWVCVRQCVGVSSHLLAPQTRKRKAKKRNIVTTHPAHSPVPHFFPSQGQGGCTPLGDQKKRRTEERGKGKKDISNIERQRTALHAPTWWVIGFDVPSCPSFPNHVSKPCHPRYAPMFAHKKEYRRRW